MEEVMDHVRGGAEGKARVRELSVLYLDVVGFTAFSERNSPEVVATMLNELFGVCEVITRECHGDIDKFIGDVVNTAARIESATEPMRMGISEATYARLKDPSGFSPGKAIHVKNRSEPVTIDLSEPDAG
jgi:class 3 adenylate cyclase